MNRTLAAILLGGLTAGALDITYACAHWYLAQGVAPVRIFQSVAAGLIGREAALAGGWEAGALGIAAHFTITLAMAAAFVLAARAMPALNRWPLFSGIVYGLGLYLVMNYVVVPLSAAGASGPPTGQFFYGALIAHTLLVGVPITLIAKRFAR